MGPPVAPGIGAARPGRGEGLVDHVPRLCLFSDIAPHDLEQGTLGDCWLMSALACMSEHEGLLRTCFLTQEWNERGKYQVRIYDGRAGKWTIITVDDMLPVKKKDNTLIFAQPNGRELWVVILEKAFAKFCGDYASLDGGHEIWAFEALTGDPVFTLQREGGKWTRFDLAHRQDKSKVAGPHEQHHASCLSLTSTHVRD